MKQDELKWKERNWVDKTLVYPLNLILENKILKTANAKVYIKENKQNNVVQSLGSF